MREISFICVSDVLRVEINPYLFDVTSLYCGSAGDYQDAKSKVVSDYQTETTRFLFTWSAFETIVRAIKALKDGRTARPEPPADCLRAVLSRKNFSTMIARCWDLESSPSLTSASFP